MSPGRQRGVVAIRRGYCQGGQSPSNNRAASNVANPPLGQSGSGGKCLKGGGSPVGTRAVAALVPILAWKRRFRGPRRASVTKTAIGSGYFLIPSSGPDKSEPPDEANRGIYAIDINHNCAGNSHPEETPGKCFSPWTDCPWRVVTRGL